MSELRVCKKRSPFDPPSPDLSTISMSYVIVRFSLLISPRVIYFICFLFASKVFAVFNLLWFSTNLV